MMIRSVSPLTMEDFVASQTLVSFQGGKSYGFETRIEQVTFFTF